MAKNWIKGAIKKPGALRKSLGMKVGQKIPAKTLATAANKPGKMGQRARFAQRLRVRFDTKEKYMPPICVCSYD